MDKDNIENLQTSIEKTVTDVKTLNDLKTTLSCLSYKLKQSQVRFVQLNQQKEVREKQEILLKKQAHDLNEIVIVEQLKLEDIRRQAEAHVENFVHKVNCVLAKNKHMFEINEEIIEKKRKEKRAYDERKKKYFELKGELEALLVFKDYQECVLDEIERKEKIKNII